jgi:LmbE family N-acetylglucosaminyl deacetylase
LDFEDGELESHHHEAEEAVRRLLAKIRPTTIFMPDKNDLHLDHSSTGAIVLDALRSSMLNPRFYAYVVWGENELRDTKTSSEVDFDISTYLTIKRAAVKEYKSQFTKLFKSQNRPIIGRSMLSRFMRPRERFTLRFPTGNT